MALTTWQATVQNEIGNTILSPVITVRKASDDSLATVYDMDGVATSNPFTGSVDGFVQFKLAPGIYNIEGAKDGADTQTWKVEIAPPSGLTRADFVTYVAGFAVPNGTVLHAGNLEYVSSTGSTAISDLPGWIPGRVVNPNHWKDNTTPGTTDMGPAIQDAFDYVFGTAGTDGAIGREPYRVVDFKPESYYVGAKIKWTGAEDYFWARGNGARLTTDIDDAIIQVGADVLFGGGDTAGEVNNYSGIISGFVFSHTDGTSTASVAIRAGLNSGMIVKENVFVDFWVAIDGHRYIGRTISDNFFMLSNLRTVQAEAFIRLQGVYNSTNGYTPGGGIHCHGNEFWGRADDPSKIRSHILIHAVDGFYHASNHYIAYEEAAIKIEPQGSTGNSRNNVIIDVISGGENYFDNPPTDARSVWLGGTVAYAGTSGQANGQYKNISFSSGDYFRGAGVARNGIFIAVTDDGGFVTARGGLHGISVNDCRFEEFFNVPIEIQGGPDSKIECVDLSITNNKFRNNNHGSFVNAGILSVVNSCTIVGNSFGEEANAPERCLSVGLDSADDGYSAIVLGNNFSNSLYTVEPYFVTTNVDTVVTLGPNLTRDGTLNENNEIYASRDDAEASKVPASRVVIEVRRPDGGTLRYKRNPGGSASNLIALTTIGGATWSPDGVNTPNHWAENITPGTTDMTAAMNAACAYSSRCDVELMAQDYLINGTIDIIGRVTGTVSFEGYRFKGPSREMCRIIQSDKTQDHLDIRPNPSATVTYMIGDVGGFDLRSNNVLKSEKGAGIRHNRNLNSIFSDILIHGPTNCIISDGSAQCWYDKIFTRGTNRTASETMDSVYTFTDNGVNRSFGNFVSNCEHQAGEMADRIFDIRSCDGLYVSNCHFNHATKKVHIRPDNSALQDHIFQLMFTNVYFDGNGSPQDVVYIEATNPGATTAAVRIEGLYFNQCHFRVGGNSVLKIGQTSGEVAGLTTLQDVIFTGCHAKEFSGRIFDLSHPTLASPATVIENVEWTGGIIEDGPLVRTGAVNAFTLQGRNVKVQGVTVKGGWDDTGEAVASIGANSVNIGVINNMFDTARTLESVARSSSSTNCYSYGNSRAAYPREYLMDSTLNITAALLPGLILGPRTSTTTSDIVTRGNAVISGETSVTHAVEAGGYIRFMTGVTDAETGTAGGTEIARVDDDGLKVDAPVVLNGVSIGADEITIADNAVGLVTLPGNRRAAVVIIHCQGSVSDVQNAQSGMVRVDAGATAAVVSIQAGANFSTSTATLTGTTGTDGNTTISPNTSQQIQIENRSGASRTYQVVML
jgi:hypothetical protein